MNEIDGYPIRVLVVDDQRLVRSGFALMLSAEPHISMVGEAANGDEAVALANQLQPDIILMDIQMPVRDGICATTEIVGRDLAKVIVLTTFDRDDYLFGALDAGASGFLLKSATPEQLIEAIEVVAAGHALLAPEVTARIIARKVDAPKSATSDVGAPPGTVSDDQIRLLSTLTSREREILGYLGRGQSNSEIAQALVVGESTVKTHVSNVLAKLQLRDRIQAVIFAYEAGLLPLGEWRRTNDG